MTEQACPDCGHSENDHGMFGCLVGADDPGHGASCGCDRKGDTFSAATVADADVRTAIMAALDLAMDYAYHDGTERELAVAATANELAGYWDVGFGVAHASREQVTTAVEAALKGRPKRLLRADARGMLQAFDMLARSGAISYTTCAACRTHRWLARGGHDRVAA